MYTVDILGVYSKSWATNHILGSHIIGLSPADKEPTLGSKKITDTTEKYLKWSFRKEKEPKNGDERGLYFEYKEIPREYPLVCFNDS